MLGKLAQRTDQLLLVIRREDLVEPPDVLLERQPPLDRVLAENARGVLAIGVADAQVRAADRKRRPGAFHVLESRPALASCLPRSPIP